MASQTDARQTCDMLISSIRDSNLNFFVQETPFSAFINIRKTFCKGGTMNYKNLVHKDKQHEKLKQENKLLKEKLEEKNVQLEASKEDMRALQSRLEKAENELFENVQNKKTSETKQGDEILKLKSVISSLKLEGVEADKALKSQEKIVYNLEKKNKNLVEQVATMKAAKNDLKSDKLNLMNEVKALKMKTFAQKKMKSSITQTDPLRSLPCTCLDNNNSSTPSTSLRSTSAQTSIGPSSSSIASQSVQCLICAETCKTADDLVEHAAAEHDISINVKKVTDFEERDSFLRFLKSMIVDQQYLEDRVKYYPENSDHIYERIKIRIIAQIKFLSFSRTFERNMRENDYKNSSYKGNYKEV